MVRSIGHYWQYGAWLYALALVGLSLYPRQHPPAIEGPKEPSSGAFPKEGDNFKAVDDVVVYHLEQGQRRPYKTGASYLQCPGNPPFGVPYEEGGILLVDSFVILLYPRGADMPRLKDTTSVGLAPVPTTVSWWQPYTQSDKLGHALVYFLWGLLLWKALATPTRKPWATAGAVFLVGMLLGLGLEWAQASFNLGRDAEWADLVMNGVGLLLGIGLGWWGQSGEVPSAEGHNTSG